jgi:hypothetical protein
MTLCKTNTCDQKTRRKVKRHMTRRVHGCAKLFPSFNTNKQYKAPARFVRFLSLFTILISIQGFRGQALHFLMSVATPQSAARHRQHGRYIFSCLFQQLSLSIRHTIDLEDRIILVFLLVGAGGVTRGGKLVPPRFPVFPSSCLLCLWLGRWVKRAWRVV